MNAKAADVKRWRDRFPGRRFVEVNGVDLHYERQGIGPPVLLVHGLGDSLATWRGVASALAAEGFDVIALDLKGSGRSERPFPSDWSTSALVEEIAGFLAALRVERAAVAGVSYGGLLSLLLAARHPERVSSLVICNALAFPYPRRTPIGLSLARLPGVDRIAPWLLSRRGLEAIYREWNFSPGYHGTVERTAEHWRHLSLPGGRRAFLALINGIDPRDVMEAPEVYPEIDAPTLILWGDRDRWFPLEQAHRLRKTLPRAALRIVPGAAHLFMEEDPPLFVRPVAAFLRRDAPSRRIAARTAISSSRRRTPSYRSSGSIPRRRS